MVVPLLSPKHSCSYSCVDFSVADFITFKYVGVCGHKWRVYYVTTKGRRDTRVKIGKQAGSGGTNYLDDDYFAHFSALRVLLRHHDIFTECYIIVESTHVESIVAQGWWCFCARHRETFRVELWETVNMRKIKDVRDGWV